MKVRLVISASGTYELEIPDEKMKPLLGEDGDIGREFLDGLPCLLAHFGLDALSPIDEAIESRDLLDALDINIEDIEVVKYARPKLANPRKTKKGKGNL